MHIVMTLFLLCHSTTTTITTTTTTTSTADRLKASTCKNLILLTLPANRPQMHAAVMSQLLTVAGSFRCKASRPLLYALSVSYCHVSILAQQIQIDWCAAFNPCHLHGHNAIHSVQWSGCLWGLEIILHLNRKKKILHQDHC